MCVVCLSVFLYFLLVQLLLAFWISFCRLILVSLVIGQFFWSCLVIFYWIMTLYFGVFFFLESVGFVLANSLVCRGIQTPLLSFARQAFIPGVFQSSIYLHWVTVHFGCWEFKNFFALSEILGVFILHFPGVCLSLPSLFSLAFCLFMWNFTFPVPGLVLSKDSREAL